MKDQYDPFLGNAEYIWAQDIFQNVFWTFLDSTEKTAVTTKALSNG